jgi:hypothetical protein
MWNYVVEIPIGRYTLTFSYENSYESHWETCWICVESVMRELDWEGTPESIYFEALELKSDLYDLDYPYKILEAMKQNPFTITEGEANEISLHTTSAVRSV